MFTWTRWQYLYLLCSSVYTRAPNQPSYLLKMWYNKVKNEEESNERKPTLQRQNTMRKVWGGNYFMSHRGGEIKLPDKYSEQISMPCVNGNCRESKMRIGRQENEPSTPLVAVNAPEDLLIHTPPSHDGHKRSATLITSCAFLTNQNGGKVVRTWFFFIPFYGKSIYL